MSKIALTPNASGSGTFTIASPNSDTDRVLTLPDGSATLATTNGITDWDGWRTTANAGISSGDIIGQQSEGFERFDDAMFDKGGTGLSLSSGVWTFPAAGYWSIAGRWQLTSGGARNYIGIHLQTTSDNGSNWTTVTGQYTHQEASQYIVAQTDYIVKISNTSTDKIRFRASLVNDVTIEGSTNYYYSGFLATRIAEI